jgi:hypothetical protein
MRFLAFFCPLFFLLLVFYLILALRGGGQVGADGFGWLAGWLVVAYLLSWGSGDMVCFVGWLDWLGSVGVRARLAKRLVLLCLWVDGSV